MGAFAQSTTGCGWRGRMKEGNGFLTQWRHWLSTHTDTNEWTWCSFPHPCSLLGRRTAGVAECCFAFRSKFEFLVKFWNTDTFRTQNLIVLLVVLYKRVTNNSLKARKSKCTQLKDEQTALQKNASWIFFLLSLHLNTVMFRVNGFFFQL